MIKFIYSITNFKKMLIYLFLLHKYLPVKNE